MNDSNSKARKAPERDEGLEKQVLHNTRKEQVDTGEEASKNSNEDVSSAKNGAPEKERQEHTRSQMALLFVLGFFAVLFLCFIYAFLIGSNLSELKDALSSVIGALSGILGFIVGYYYKTSQEQ